MQIHIVKSGKYTLEELHHIASRKTIAVIGESNVKARPQTLRSFVELNGLKSKLLNQA